MEINELAEQFLGLSTPQIADACIRQNRAIRIAAPGI